jgi:hypothetical protein
MDQDNILVLIYMTSRTTQELSRLLGTPGTIPSEANRGEIITQLEAEIEVHIACCNPMIPAQRLTVTVPRIIVRKMEFVSRAAVANFNSKEKRPNFDNENTCLISSPYPTTN